MKRAFDMLAAGMAIVLLSPLLVLVTVAIWLEDGGPALFRQSRIGRNGGGFIILKFRSMPVNVGEVPSAQAGTLPVTRIGRIIRRTNIDELPQLFNILIGDMSVVGPRPALPAQEHLVAIRRENGALRCRPGMTGLAQVSAYSGMPDEEKARYDSDYARNVTFLRDIGIMLRTVAYLLRPPPVY